MSTSSSSDEEVDYRQTREQQHRTAKKSTTTPVVTMPVTRAYAIRQTKTSYTANNPKTLARDRFLENFNPETSVREKRKLSRKINPPSTIRRPPGALYDENGVHITSYTDLCDCLNEECIGCFFQCPKCNSPKCGIDCRVHRKYMYDQVEYHGYDIVVKNPIGRT